jgi:ABC-type uncharacterized transport system permease subunit
MQCCISIGALLCFDTNETYAFSIALVLFPPSLLLLVPCKKGMASTSTAWVATHCAALTCHGAELCRSSNPDMTIQPKHNQVG